MKWILTGLVPLVLATAGTAQTDLSIDAVTRATTLNTMVGDVAVLTDGITPETYADAASVSWGGVGLLVVEWPEPVRLSRIRIYLGLMERYGLFAYLGGHFTDTGQRVDVEEPAYSREGLAPLESNLWFEIECRPDIPVDNIALSLVGTTVLYEVQFLGSTSTVIEPATLGIIKARQQRHHNTGLTDR